MVTKVPNADTTVAPKLMMLRKQHARLVASSTKANAGPRKAMPDAFRMACKKKI